MKIIDKLAWIAIKDKKLLVVRSHNKDLFYLPGGKRDVGETDTEALMREINEELTVNLTKSSIKPFSIYSAQADGKAEGIEVQLTCYFADYTGELTPAAEIAEMQWVGYDEQDKLSLAAKVVMQALHKQELI